LKAPPGGWARATPQARVVPDRITLLFAQGFLSQNEAGPQRSAQTLRYGPTDGTAPVPTARPGCEGASIPRTRPRLASMAGRAVSRWAPGAQGKTFSLPGFEIKGADRRAGIKPADRRGRGQVEPIVRASRDAIWLERLTD